MPRPSRHGARGNWWGEARARTIVGVPTVGGENVGTGSSVPRAAAVWSATAIKDAPTRGRRLRGTARSRCSAPLRSPTGTSGGAVA